MLIALACHPVFVLLMISLFVHMCQVVLIPVCFLLNHSIPKTPTLTCTFHSPSLSHSLPPSLSLSLPLPPPSLSPPLSLSGSLQLQQSRHFYMRFKTSIAPVKKQLSKFGGTVVRIYYTL